MARYIGNLQEQIAHYCRFCNPPERERILYETENFYVMVSLGPIVEGYLLIVSKQHIGAMLNIPQEMLLEFLKLKQKVSDTLSHLYGGCIFYEHGKIGTSLTIDGHLHCFHAHLHCVPATFCLSEDVDMEYAGESFLSFDDCYRKLIDRDKYLYVEDKCVRIYSPNHKPRSQYLRFKFASHLNLIDRWDWVNNQNWDLIYTSINRLKPFFS